MDTDTTANNSTLSPTITEPVTAEPDSSTATPEVKYFECSNCILKEKYDYYGKTPPFVKDYKFQEDSYVIEDPFLPPKQGEFIVLGSHCIKCNRTICKDMNCSFYYDGTYCIACAKQSKHLFPSSLQEKLSKIIIP